MHITLHLILGLMFIGLIAGFVDGIAGGGGLLTVPALSAVGLPPHLTLGTNKFAFAFGVFSSSLTYIKKGIFNPLLWQAAILAVLCGGIMGALATHIFSSRFFNYLLPIIIISVAIYMLIPKPYLQFTVTKQFKPNKFSSAILGTMLGFYDGFMGPGAGSFWTSLVMAIYKLDLLTASGVARFMNFMSTLVAAITFMSLHNVDYSVAGYLAITVIAGSFMGARAAIRFGHKFIKPIFLLMVIALAVRVVYVEWF